MNQIVTALVALVLMLAVPSVATAQTFDERTDEWSGKRSLRVKIPIDCGRNQWTLHMLRLDDPKVGDAVGAWVELPDSRFYVRDHGRALVRIDGAEADVTGRKRTEYVNGFWTTIWLPSERSFWEKVRDAKEVKFRFGALICELGPTEKESIGKVLAWEPVVQPAE